ncbi:MAG: hypothetical protein ACLULL_05760 [Parabacteroides distasonis]
MLEAARMLQKKGYDIFATGGSSKFLTENGVRTPVFIGPVKRDILRHSRCCIRKEIDMVVNIPKNLTAGRTGQWLQDPVAAIDLNIPLITNARLEERVYQCVLHDGH